MDSLITLLIGITIGTTLTYGILHRPQRRKISRLERLIEQYQLDLEDCRRATTPQTPNEPPIAIPVLQPAPRKLKISKENLIIQAFLSSKGIEIRTLPRPKAADTTLDRIAVFMGTRYSSIEPLYGKIKSNMNAGKTFNLNLKNYAEQEVSSICQFGKLLHEIAFLEEYYYQRSPRYLLHVKTSKSAPALNFISGHWLERFIKEQVIQVIESTNSKLKYSYLMNPQVILPDGADFELDVIFQIEEEIFWFEAKTGEYQKHVDKYSQVSALLDLNAKHSYMVLLDSPEAHTKTLSSLFKMTVVNLEQFTEKFTKALKKYAVKNSIQPDAIPTDAIPTDAIPTDAIQPEVIPTDAIQPEAIPTEV